MNYEEHVEFTAEVKADDSDEEFKQRVDLAEEESKRLALEAALRFEPHTDYVIDDPIPLVFGGRWEQRLSRTRTRLIERHSDATNDLIRLASRCFEYSKQQSAAFLSVLCRTRPSDEPETEHWARLRTPDGYADNEGWANTAYNGVLASIEKPQELLHDTSFHEYPVESDLLEANGLIWFFEASRLHQTDTGAAMDRLYEAADALDLANGSFMWNEAYKLAQEDFAKTQSQGSANKAAATLAKKRHAENYAFAAYAVEYWKKNIDPSLSASKAANELIGVVKLSHKKLSEIVSAEKKKL